MRSSLRRFSPLLTLAALALLSGCSTNLFGSRHAVVDTGPVVEGHPLILPPDFALRPPRQAADYESSLPKEHFGARKVVVGQRTVRDETRVTSLTVVTVSESTLSTAPAIPNPADRQAVVPTASLPPLSTTPAGLDANVAGATATDATATGTTVNSAASVSGTDEVQAAVARDTAQEQADNQGFFHKYFGWMIPGHGRK